MSVPGDGLEVLCGLLHLGQVNVTHRQLYLQKLYLVVKGEYRTQSLANVAQPAALPAEMINRSFKESTEFIVGQCGSPAAFPEAEFSDVIGIKVCKSFPSAIHSHLF
jgi:hypothetical protein